jgi:hypothetical protein
LAQIRPVTSEALEALIRRLLPSQNGFGEDLQASNVITPIIDLTPTAEGSVLPYELQTAQAFGSQTSFNIGGTTSTIINTTGFYSVRGTWAIVGNTASFQNIEFKLNDGATTKTIYNYRKLSGSSLAEFLCGDYEFVVFLQTGESLEFTVSNNANTTGSYRQIADVNGNLVNPSGYSPQ